MALQITSLHQHIADFMKVEFGLNDNQLRDYREGKDIVERHKALQKILEEHAQIEYIKHYIEGMQHMVEAFDSRNEKHLGTHV